MSVRLGPSPWLCATVPSLSMKLGLEPSRALSTTREMSAAKPGTATALPLAPFIDDQVGALHADDRLPTRDASAADR